jgi:excisionase family DNA binding protein
MDTPNNEGTNSVPETSVDVLRQSNPMTTLQLDFLSPKQVAAMLGVTSQTIYRLIHKRLLPVYRVTRRVRFKRSDVIAYLEKHKTDVAPTESHGPQE